jgi:dephospho-CoA kinase
MGENKLHQDHFIIGLTGNIGTGKSIVRIMLQHLGAYGIDADILAHQALKTNGPAHDQIIHRYGSSILDTHGAIDRSKLARTVFSDEKALVDLENILHPLIATAAANMIHHARLPIIVIEAIKLLESDLAKICDSIWVVDAQKQVVLERLSCERGMNHAEIQKRLSHQSIPENKIQQSDVVIDNSGDVYKTWQQVTKAWDQTQQKNQKFSVCINKTSDLLAFTKDFLITPSSNNYSAVEEIIYTDNQSGKTIKWLGINSNIPHFQKNYPRQGFMRLVCQHFLFAIPNSFASERITIWNLSQLALTLLGHNFSHSDIVTNDFKNTVTLIERFSLVHATRRIILPIEDHLKERTSYFRDRGYISILSKNAGISYWNKAGYNLYQKKTGNDFDLFSKQT